MSFSFPFSSFFAGYGYVLSRIDVFVQQILANSFFGLTNDPLSKPIVLPGKLTVRTAEIPDGFLTIRLWVSARQIPIPESMNILFSVFPEGGDEADGGEGYAYGEVLGIQSAL